MTMTAHKPFVKASDAQGNLIRALVSERVLDSETEDWVSAARHFWRRGEFSSSAAKPLISHLLALPRKESAPAPETPAEPAPQPQRTNRYPGACEECGTVVEAEEGILSKADSGKWEVTHLDGGCPVTEFPFPLGRYALVSEDGEVKFYRATVDGLFAQGGSDLYRVTSGAAGVVEAIAADPESASRLYGREIGSCGRCGRTLTDTASREAGIGPVCASKGW